MIVYIRMKIIHNVILCYLIIKLLFSKSIFLMGFPGGSDGKESSCNAGGSRDRGLILELGRSPGEGQWQPTPVFLPGESPWTEDPGRLQSMGLQRVGHD